MSSSPCQSVVLCGMNLSTDAKAVARNLHFVLTALPVHQSGFCHFIAAGIRQSSYAQSWFWFPRASLSLQQCLNNGPTGVWAEEGSGEQEWQDGSCDKLLRITK